MNNLASVFLENLMCYIMFLQIRLFGDPRDNAGQEIPTLKMNVVVSLEEKCKTVVRQASHDVICDFVDGRAFGDALGVGLRSIDGWWNVENLELPEHFPKVGVWMAEARILDD